MKATIYVIRELESIEYHFAVRVSLDKDGDVEATVIEDVPEKGWTRRYGGMDLEETGGLVYAEGDEIELDDEEIDEAKKAISDMGKAWDEERAKLKQVFAPDPSIKRTEEEAMQSEHYINAMSELKLRAQRGEI